MHGTSLFIGLTRPVSLMGLPMMYVVMLVSISVGGFVLLDSILYLILSAPISYLILRSLASYDPKLIDVYMVTVRSSNLYLDHFKKKGMNFHA